MFCNLILLHSPLRSMFVTRWPKSIARFVMCSHRASGTPWDTLCHGVSMVHLRIFGHQCPPVAYTNAWSICGLDVQVKKLASGKRPCKCLNGSCQASWNPMSWHLPVLFVHVLGMAVSKLWPSCKLWLHGRCIAKIVRHSTQPSSLYFWCFKNGHCCLRAYIFW